MELRKQGVELGLDGTDWPKLKGVGSRMMTAAALDICTKGCESAVQESSHAVYMKFSQLRNSSPVLRAYILVLLHVAVSSSNLGHVDRTFDNVMACRVCEQPG